ncbi:MAG TPA: acyl-CoA dehydrogenase family protein [Candidatus Paceibacterota bacterium]|nr:acyl-CoA/acyl-ACP dehydrogenase [Verrucomicrobiota bacterium]HOX03572.1 acyl-CoA dehydrogenase family protein [Verrucomicrobiota bacterium]HRZ46461.1 acyl-CoA dehydrogenase family protein [Candidatus Paceibacterota bacterium]
METPTPTPASATLETLPGDDVRQIMWRYADRYDLAMLVQAARSVARGPVAELVARGARNTHEWTADKAGLLQVFDESGITAAFMDPEHGGFIAGPKNLALALIAFELSWVDAGAATCSLAGNLGLAPIHERGTPDQKAHYMSRSAPARPGETRSTWRGAFALTEPLPFVGVETGLLGGKVRVARWEEGQEPVLEVDKRGRFITNMGFANFVTAAVESDDPRIQGSCMIILEEGDPGLFDRGTPTRKLVHQLSSTRDPVFRLEVPASRIIGGYTIQKGVIVPRFSHGEVIEAVFRRTRVTVGLMTAAKLLSAVEPVIRYQRGRFRGGEGGGAGSPRFDLGLQQKQDALHRLADVWATGEASASLGFAAARLFDQLDPFERRKDEWFAAEKIEGARARMKALGKARQDALELIRLESKGEGQRDAERFRALHEDPLVQYVLLDAEANVLCPACKLWNTGHGANMMREAVSLMGGYGVTEDCPGFLGQKWMDAQLEATYEGPEAVQRRQLTVTMADDLFLARMEQWHGELRRIAGDRPATGACTLATAMRLWLWTLRFLQRTRDGEGAKLFHGTRQGVTFPLADALCWLLSARAFLEDVLELEHRGPSHPVVAGGLAGWMGFYMDLCHVQCARAAGEVGRICAELVFGYQRHPAWDKAGCEACYSAEELDALEGLASGIASAAPACTDVQDPSGRPPDKAGPCAAVEGQDEFLRLRRRLDGCLTGSGLAKDRAAEALTRVMIPEALDYP